MSAYEYHITIRSGDSVFDDHVVTVQIDGADPSPGLDSVGTEIVATLYDRSNTALDVLTLADSEIEVIDASSYKILNKRFEPEWGTYFWDTSIQLSDGVVYTVAYGTVFVLQGRAAQEIA